MPHGACCALVLQHRCLPQPPPVQGHDHRCPSPLFVMLNCLVIAVSAQQSSQHHPPSPRAIPHLLPSHRHPFHAHRSKGTRWAQLSHPPMHHSAPCPYLTTTQSSPSSPGAHCLPACPSQPCHAHFGEFWHLLGVLPAPGALGSSPSLQGFE